MGRRHVDRTRELIAICNGIIRNAPRITENMEWDQRITITIDLGISGEKIPTVEINKTFVPTEIINLYRAQDGVKE